MKPKCLFLFFFYGDRICRIQSKDNLHFSPEQPRPGEKLIFEYSTVGTVLGELNDFESSTYIQDCNVRAQEIEIKKSDRKWTGTIVTNATTRAILPVFKNGEKIDNNKEQGYPMLMIENGKPVKGAYTGMAGPHHKPS